MRHADPCTTGSHDMAKNNKDQHASHCGAGMTGQLISAWRVRPSRRAATPTRAAVEPSAENRACVGVACPLQTRTPSLSPGSPPAASPPTGLGDLPRRQTRAAVITPAPVHSPEDPVTPQGRRLV